MLLRLQSEPISTDELLEAVRGDRNGAVALFLGTVRDHNRGRSVEYLEYHAYEEMAQEQLRRLADQAGERWDFGSVAVAHRTGRLGIGEISVAVAVGAPHRADALAACKFLIDELKRSVPIWKKEVFDGGEVWIEDQP